MRGELIGLPEVLATQLATGIPRLSIGIALLMASGDKTFDNTPPIKHTWSIELYLDNPDALQKAHDRYCGSQGLLCCAAQCLADARRGDDAKSSHQSGDNEVRALRQFLEEAGLCMAPAAVRALFEANPMRGGSYVMIAAG